MSELSENRQERLERATSERLGSLRDTPIDAAAFLKRLENEIPPKSLPARRFPLKWLSRSRAIAASLVAMALIAALVMNSSSGLLLASAERLAQVHQEVLTAEDDHVIRVDSTAAANAAMTAKWPGAPLLPDVPNDPVLYCCLHTIASKKIACVVLKHDDVPVTLAVAAASDVRVPEGDTFDANGVSYRIQAYQGINMVMTERDGRWICLMSKLPLDRMKSIVTSLRF